MKFLYFLFSLIFFLLFNFGSIFYLFIVFFLKADEQVLKHYFLLIGLLLFGLSRGDSCKGLLGFEMLLSSSFVALA